MSSQGRHRGFANSTTAMCRSAWVLCVTSSLFQDDCFKGSERVVQLLPHTVHPLTISLRVRRLLVPFYSMQHEPFEFLLSFWTWGKAEREREKA